MKKPIFSCLLLMLLALTIYFAKKKPPSFEQQVASLDQLIDNEAYPKVIATIDNYFHEANDLTESQKVNLKIRKGIAFIWTEKTDTASILLRETQNYFLSKQDTLNTYYPYVLDGLALLKMNDSQYKEAEFLFQQAMLIREKVGGKEHLEYARSLNNLGLLQYQMAKYDQSESLLLEVKKIRLKKLGSKNPLYAKTLNDIGRLYIQMAKYDESESLLLEAKKIRQKVFGTNHAVYASSLNDIAELYRETGKFNEAEKLLKQAIAIREKVYDHVHPVYASSLSNLAELYSKMEKYKEAAPLYLQVKEIVLEVFGEDYPQYAEAIDNLGSHYYDIGEYDEALCFFHDARLIRQEVLGMEHPDYAESLSNIAGIKFKRKKYAEAESLFKQDIEIREKTLGVEHPDYATSLNNLGILYSKQGSYEKVEPLIKAAKKIREKAFGKVHPKIANSLNSLGTLYFRTGKVEEADSLFMKAIEIRKKVYGAQHSKYANSIYNLGMLYFKKKKYKKSEPLFLKAVEVYRTMLGEDHPDYAIFLNNLGRLFAKMKNYAKAESLFQQAIEINKKAYGTAHKAYANSIRNLGEIYLELEKYEQAKDFLLEENNIRKQLLIRTFNTLSEKDKANYQERIIGEFNSLKTLSLHYQDADITSALYDLSLFEKGLKLNTSLQTRQYILSMKGSEAEEKHQMLNACYQLISKENEQPISDRIGVDSLEIEIEKLEKYLASASAQFRKELKMNRINSKDIRSLLADDEIAIEFTHFKYIDTDSIIYTAIILDPTKEDIAMVPLFSENNPVMSELDKMSRSRIKRIYNYASPESYAKAGKKTIYDLIWKPLENLLEGKRRIYYSSSGLLHRINLDAIPISKDEIMCNAYEMHNLLNTKAIALEHQTTSNMHAYTVGDVNYDTEKMKQKGRHGTLKSLPESKTETVEINKSLSKAGYQVTYKNQNKSTEESFKVLGTQEQSPEIIHLATHGFFVCETENKTSSAHKTAEEIADNPMQRSGLMLYGANHAWEGNTPIEGKEDGILRAEEISHMNLSNTELVVLSACSSGLGDIEGNEGVYGLQRAFKKAGVHYLMMTLWEVSDVETKEFMIAFYENWLEKKMTIRTAFNTTQLEMKGKYPDPHKWAGFVLIE